MAARIVSGFVSGFYPGLERLRRSDAVSEPGQVNPETRTPLENRVFSGLLPGQPVFLKRVRVYGETKPQVIGGKENGTRTGTRTGVRHMTQWCLDGWYTDRALADEVATFVVEQGCTTQADVVRSDHGTWAVVYFGAPLFPNHAAPLWARDLAKATRETP